MQKDAGPRIRLYVPADLAADAAVDLSADQAHYLLHVMRRAVGDAVALFNGRDGEWEAEIVEVRKKKCTLRARRRVREQGPRPDLWLLFAPLKQARLDYLIQKATEMGAGVIQPVVTARTQVARLKTERLAANAIEAAEQCGLTSVPEILDPVPLGRLLADWETRAPGRLILFCDEGMAAASPLAVLQQADRERPWAILIGPEGGFDEEERRRLHARPDTLAVSLGPRIMRADTAAVAAMAAFQLVIGDWDPAGSPSKI